MKLQNRVTPEAIAPAQGEGLVRNLGTAALARLAGLLLRRVPAGDSVRLDRARHPDDLLDIGRLRRHVMARCGMDRVLDELSPLGLEAEDNGAWHYVLRHNGRIVGCLRAARGAPLSRRHLGEDEFRRLLGPPDRYAELGRLAVAADVPMRGASQALLAFAALHLTMICGVTRYAAYVSERNARRAGYLSSRCRHSFTIDRGRGGEPYVLCADSLIPLLARAAKRMAGSLGPKGRADVASRRERWGSAAGDD